MELAELDDAFEVSGDCDGDDNEDGSGDDGDDDDAGDRIDGIGIGDAGSGSEDVCGRKDAEDDGRGDGEVGRATDSEVGEGDFVMALAVS